MRFSTKTPLILLMSGFFWKRKAFWGAKNSTLTQSNLSMKAVIEMF